MTDELSISDVMPVSIERLYRAFLSSAEHTAMTGARATASDEIDGAFTAWDGYIRGTNLVLERDRRIVQSWRAADFPAGSDDSRLEIIFAPRGDETEITFIHTDLPSGMGDGFTEGWQKYYLVPMRAYFARHLHAKADDAIEDGSEPNDVASVEARQGRSALSTEPTLPSKKPQRLSKKAPPRAAKRASPKPAPVAKKPKKKAPSATAPSKKAPSAKSSAKKKSTKKTLTPKVASKKAALEKVAPKKPSSKTTSSKSAPTKSARSAKPKARAKKKAR